MKRGAITGILLLGLTMTYVFGAMSYHRGYWPIPQLRAIKQSATPFTPENHAIMDELDRLVSFGGKIEIECPEQTDQTMVLLIAGQSNAANSAGQRYIGDSGVINYFAGKCYVAQSPLLGTTGIAGESWTPLGNRLVRLGLANRVILIPTAMSGTSIVRWEQGGDLNGMLKSVIADVRKRYEITHVLWHQGEWDVGFLTRQQYRDKFSTLLQTIREGGIKAPVYVSIATRCGLTNIPWNADNEIALAQKSLPDTALNVRSGVNSDNLLGPLDRMDDCHFAESGQEKFVQAWTNILTDKARLAHAN